MSLDLRHSFPTHHETRLRWYGCECGGEKPRFYFPKIDKQINIQINQQKQKKGGKAMFETSKKYLAETISFENSKPVFFEFTSIEKVDEEPIEKDAPPILKIKTIQMYSKN